MTMSAINPTVRGGSSGVGAAHKKTVKKQYVPNDAHVQTYRDYKLYMQRQERMAKKMVEDPPQNVGLGEIIKSLLMTILSLAICVDIFVFRGRGIDALFSGVTTVIKELFGGGPKDPPSGGSGKGSFQDFLNAAKKSGAVVVIDEVPGLTGVRKGRSKMVPLAGLMRRSIVVNRFASAVGASAAMRLARQVRRMTPQRRQVISAQQFAIGAAVVGSALLLRGLVRNPVAQKGLQRATAFVR